MLLRRLLVFAVLMVIHAVASCVAIVVASAAAMSPGGGWIVAVVSGTFFFPVVVLDTTGIAIVPLDSLLGLVVNSALWVAVVYPLWLALGWVRSKRAMSSD